jgi:hypothetical protein
LDIGLCAFEYLHIYVRSTFKHKIQNSFVSRVSYAHSLTVILHSMFICLRFDLDLSHEVRCGIVHCGVMLVLKRFKLGGISDIERKGA